MEWRRWNLRRQARLTQWSNFEVIRSQSCSQRAPALAGRQRGRTFLVAARVGYLFTADGGRSFAATAAFSTSSLCYVNIFLRNVNITRSNVVIEIENVNLSTARWTKFSRRTPWQMLNTERPQRESRVALPSVQCAAQDELKI